MVDLSDLAHLSDDDPFKGAQRRVEEQRAAGIDLGFFLNQEEKTAYERREEKMMSDYRAAKEAELAKEKLKRGDTSLNGPRELIARPLTGVQPRAIHWVWRGWIPLGYITLMAGETGAGKSTVLADIMARITTGKPWPGEPADAMRPPGRVLWLGSEDSVEEMLVPRLMACGANQNHIVVLDVKQQGKMTTFSMQDDLEAVRSGLAIARDAGSPFAMLVIDPVTSYLPGQKLRKVDLNDAGQLRTILEPWLRLAQEYSIAIVCVTHFAKDTTRSMLHRVLGSAAFAQTCRSLIAVIERPETEDYAPGPHEKVMLQVKVNLPEHPGGAWKFSTVKVEVARDTHIPIHATRPDWQELDSFLTPKSAIGKPRGPKSHFDIPFGIWLKAFFTTYPAGQWLRVDLVKTMAVSQQASSESYWDKHSNEFLEKKNEGGFWFCRPKTVPIGN
jgi:hypothetical protein